MTYPSTHQWRGILKIHLIWQQDSIVPISNEIFCHASVGFQAREVDILAESNIICGFAF
jgi:hypothetical protein